MTAWESGQDGLASSGTINHMDPNKLVGLLGEPNRRRVIAALLLGAATRDDVGTATGFTAREVQQSLDRLQSAGLVEVVGDDLFILESAFDLASRAAPAVQAAGGPGRSNDPETVLDRCVVDGRIVHWPSKHSHRLVVLNWLVQRFEPGVRYSEREVNAEMRKAHDDHAAMRRYLVEVGFLDRANGEYWRSGGSVSEQA